MGFKEEPTGYIKTVVSELQGSWGNLKNAVADSYGFPNSDKLMFHIHEGMSWESVRNLDKMKEVLVLIKNIVNQDEIPDEVIFWVDDVHDALLDTLKAIKNGEAE